MIGNKYTSRLILAFGSANPDLNLQTADLFSKEALAKYQWPDGVDQKTLLQDLRIRQRLLKVHPDEQVAEVLEAEGFHSAHHIVATGLPDFTQKVTPGLSRLSGTAKPRALCAKIFERAERIRRASFELALAAPATDAVAAKTEGVVSPKGALRPDFQQGIPDYQRLFGPTIACDCTACESIFGPAAYFTDLMRVVGRYVTPPIEPMLHLNYRRPDLWRIPLDCNASDTELNYLSLVNQVMLAHMQANYTAGSDPLRVLASEIAPFSAPFNKPLAEIREGLQTLDTSLAALYRLLNVDSTALEAERLLLSSEQLALVVGTYKPSLAGLYGLEDSDSDDEAVADLLSTQKAFLRQTGLFPKQLEALVYQDLHAGRKGYVMEDRGSQDAFTKSFSEAKFCGSLTLECWIYPTNTPTHMRIAGKEEEFYLSLNGLKVEGCFFTSSKVVVCPSQATLVMNTWTHVAMTRNVEDGTCAIFINGQEDVTYTQLEAPIAAQQTVFGIGYVSGGSSFEGRMTELRLWSSARTGQQIQEMMYDRLEQNLPEAILAYWPLNEQSGTVAFDRGPSALHATGENYTTGCVDWVPFDRTAERSPVLLHSLFVNRLLPSGQYLLLEPADLASGTVAGIRLSDGYGSAPLSEQALRQLAGFIRLQAQSGWSFADLDWLLKSLTSAFEIPEQMTINDQLIEGLGQVATLAEKYAIPTDELSALWYDMKTYGRDGDPSSAALWDRVFNAAPGFACKPVDDQPAYYRPVYALNPHFTSPIFEWAFDDASEAGSQQMGNQLAAALKISGADLFVLIDAVTVGKGPVRLTVPLLSQYYRIARCARMLKLNLADFIRLSEMAGSALSSERLRWTVPEVQRLCALAEWMQKTKLSIDQVVYLSSDSAALPSLNLTGPAALEKALKDMQQSAAPAMVQAADLANDHLSSATAQQVVEALTAAEIISLTGLVWQPEAELDVVLAFLTAEDRKAIGVLLQEAFAVQQALPVKTLASLTGLDADTMAGVAYLSSREVDNAAMFAKPPYAPYPYFPNLLLAPSAEDDETRWVFLSVLQRNAALARWLRLNGAEMTAVLTYSRFLGAGQIGYGTTCWSVEQLIAWSTYTSLQKYCSDPSGLLAYFRLAVVADADTKQPSEEQLALLAALTGWNALELQQIVQQDYLGMIDFNTVLGLRKLADIMEAEAKIGTGIASLNLLRSLSVTDLFSGASEAVWQQYTDAAAGIFALVEGKGGTSAVEALRDQVAVQLRDRLCAWMIRSLRSGIAGLDSREDLYEYLLIDVNMAPAVKTSVMVAGMYSVQLYVNRIINNLEAGVVNAIPKRWWEWMSAYRVWQANREVYLYPENYVDPALRKFSSPSFSDFITEVSKGQATDEQTRLALASYLESIAGFSNIDLVDGYMDSFDSKIPGLGDGSGMRRLFLVGKTRNAPARYFTRMLLFTSPEDASDAYTGSASAPAMKIGPWEELGLNINSDFLSVVTAFGRQFVFWVEQTEVMDTDAAKYLRVTATIYFSYRDFSGNWIEPRMFRKDILIQVSGTNIGSIRYYNGRLTGAGMAVANNTEVRDFYKRPEWNKVRLQMIPASGSEPESLMVVLGPYVTCDPMHNSPTPKPDYSGMNADAKRLQQQLYGAAAFSFKNKGKYTTVIPPFFMDSMLHVNQRYVAIDTSAGQTLSSVLIRGGRGYGLVVSPTSSLLNPLVVPPYSRWPCMYNEGFIQNNETVIDSLSGCDARLQGELIGVSPGVFPANPELTMPNFSQAYIDFDWAQNALRQAYSFTFWLYLQSSIAEGTLIFSKSYSYDTSRNSILGMRYHNGCLEIQYVCGKDGKIYGLQEKIETEGWYFITLTTNPQEVVLYVNGLSMRGSSSGLNLAGSGNYLRFGNFPGYAFDFQFHHSGLTALQVRALYQAEPAELYLSGLQPGMADVQPVGNSAGAFLFNYSTQAYLMLPEAGNHAISDCLESVDADSGSVQLRYGKSPLCSADLPRMRFVRMNTAVIQPMADILTRTGFEGLFQPAVQYLQEDSLSGFNPTELASLPEDDSADFNGAFGLYLWEVFFYAPYYIAERLRRAGAFEEAQKWYRYIFDPTSQSMPVAYWPLNRMLSGRFPDLAGHEAATPYNLTEVAEAATPFSRKPRQTWSFKVAEMSCLNVPYAERLNPETFSIGAWIKPGSVPADGNFYSIACSQSGNMGYHLAMWGRGNGTWTFDLDIGTDDSRLLHVASPLSSAFGDWIHVMGVYDGTHLRLYVNGKSPEATWTFCDNFRCNTKSNLIIGAGSSVSTEGNFFDGIIAEVLLFDYGLSRGQVGQLYADYEELYVNSNFWNFRPFRRVNASSLYHILNGDAWQESFFQPAEYYSAGMQMAVYQYDAFDPDTLARLRINSWQKATVMRYVDNLIDWGDALFTRDTREAVTDATMLYTTAAKVLGPASRQRLIRDEKETRTYSDLEAEYGEAMIPPFLVETEHQLSGTVADARLPEQVQSVLDAYFCIPGNKQLSKYRELVADRLFKIRHGLTITGASNTRPLFDAALDPAALVSAASGRQGLAATPAVAVSNVPWYRFSYMLAQARSLTAEVNRLGNELLVALEKRDSEYLSKLQAGYQVGLNNLLVQIKVSQLNQLQYIGEGLQASLANAKLSYATYSAWVQEQLNVEEAMALQILNDAAVVQTLSAGVKSLAVLSYLFPTVFGLANGGFNPGESLNVSAGVMDAFSQVMHTKSQMASQSGQYQRRQEEWSLQMQSAENHIREVEAQIEAHAFSLQAAEQDMEMTIAQFRQSEEVYHFLQTKFTNETLYDWMSGQLSVLYAQMFQLAWSLSKSAQTALQYELNINQSFLNMAAWNGRYKGLVAGDALALALQQMESAYLEGNRRRLEIRKVWSMREHNPQALLTLMQTGSCRFDLDELSYDLDFPGHYNRKIKSLSITIPAVVGPYQNIHATLVQTGNTVVAKANVDAVKYLLGLSASTPSDGSLRVNWNPNQEVILSTGISDTGMFQLNLNDEQYLPFEGTGAVSSWSLRMPQASNGFSLQSVNDVIVTVDYTAEDGGSTFAAQVTALPPLSEYKGWQYLSLRQLYSTAWFDFCAHPVDEVYTLGFELLPKMYPANLDAGSVRLGNGKGEIILLPILREDSRAALPVFCMNNVSADWSSDTGLVSVADAGQDVPVPGKGNPWILTARNVPEALLSDGKIDQEKLLDIVLLIPFSGRLSW